MIARNSALLSILTKHEGELACVVVGCARVVTEIARSPRELTFKTGTVISLLKKDKSGWWKGAIQLAANDDENARDCARVVRGLLTHCCVV
jgi:hypothetical protein